MSSYKHSRVLEYIRTHPSLSSKEIHEGMEETMGYSTLKRVLSELQVEQLIVAEGSGKATRYKCGPAYQLFFPIDMEEYFKKEIDERNILPGFNLDLIKKVLPSTALFKAGEMRFLQGLQERYEKKLEQLSASLYQKEMERLSIDLSWKSSQIEGNTYTLLETERLLREKQTADGKTNMEARMLLNHKDAIDLVLGGAHKLFPIDRSKIEKIHSALVFGLGVESGIRTTGVGITGTNYTPPAFEQEILRALTQVCQLVNSRENSFEKALLLLVLISYIQPFSDGNKRTARIVCNASLINDHHCPLSFRTTDSLTFKKAMLLFYEQNNISQMKNIFMEQYEFSVTTYF